MNFYKVLLISEDKSLISSTVSGKALIHYKKGEESKPQEWLWKYGYGICIFKNYEDAKWFINSHACRPNCNYQIWIVKPGSIIIHKDTLPDQLSMENLSKGEIGKVRFSSWWPAGTIMTNSITLIRKVRN